MKIINKNLMTLCLAATTAASVYAQEAATGYFMENNYMRWEMNPALGNRNNYVGFPGLGNLNVTTNGNFGPKDIVYPYNGKTVLFTNPNISAQEALGNLNSVNRFTTSENIGILQGGFKAFGGYNNIAINVKANACVELPYSIFSLAKEGISNKTYDITDLHLKAAAYAEIALNHSRDIKPVPGLRAGVTLKLLLPVGFAEADFNELALELGQDNWKARANANLRVGLDGLKYKTKLDDTSHQYYVNGANTDDLKVGVNGFGFAFDLGATYQWTDFTFSLALTDLGMLNFNSVQEASTNGTKTFETAAHEIGIGDGGKAWDNLVDDLSPLYQLHDNGNIGSTSMALQGKFRAGVDYKFPLYNKLHFGLMNTTQFSSIAPSTEFRLSANVEPVKGVAASLSAAAGTYGATYGFLLGLGNKGFNFMIGMDYATLKFDKNYIPLTSNVDVHIGMNFPF